MSRKKEQRTFTIFVEGDSEMMYFKALNQQQWVRNSKYKLNLIRCKNHDELLKIAFGEKKYQRKKLSFFDKVAFVVDKDHMTRERFDQLLKMDYAIGFSNPKFELWLLAHFEKLQENYPNVEKNLRKYILGYHKTHSQIAYLAKKHDQAIQNVGEKNKPKFDKVCTSVGSVIQEIL